MPGKQIIMENKEDVYTVINNEEKTPQVDDVTQDHEDVRSNHSSQRVSISFFKTTKLKGKSYQARKKRINDLLNQLEEDSLSNHSEHLQEQAIMLSLMLKSIEIYKIIILC